MKIVLVIVAIGLAVAASKPNVSDRKATQRYVPQYPPIPCGGDYKKIISCTSNDGSTVTTAGSYHKLIWCMTAFGITSYECKENRNDSVDRNENICKETDTERQCKEKKMLEFRKGYWRRYAKTMAKRHNGYRGR